MIAGRPSGHAVDTAVETLRHDIFHGVLRPGSRLDEVSLGVRLDVSRNTLREAFRVLAQQRLVVHEPNRGVFVRTLGPRETMDLYAARRIVECGALRETGVLLADAGIRDEGQGPDLQAYRERVVALREAVERGRAAEEAGDWRGVSVANNRFHSVLCGLPDNAVLRVIGDALMNQARLLFVDLDDARSVHERYLPYNEEILRLVESEQLPRAVVVLEEYLLRAETHLLESVREHAVP